MSLIDHLEELRSRIIKIAIFFIVAAVVAWFFHVQIFEAMLHPAPALNGKLSFTGLTSPFFTDLKLTLYAAFLLTIPVLIYQIWAFVAPAVGDMGRTFTYILISLASSLFLAGVAFGYFVVLPVGINFFLGWDPDRYEEIITADTYLGFVSRFLLAFGIVFELPAATLVGAQLGLITASFLRKYRRHAIVVNAVLAAALTPTPDPFSMMLMMIPMVLMYEISILIARLVNPVTPEEQLPAEQDDEDEREDEREDAVERDL